MFASVHRAEVRAVALPRPECSAQRAPRVRVPRFSLLSRADVTRLRRQAPSTSRLICCPESQFQQRRVHWCVCSRPRCARARQREHRLYFSVAPYGESSLHADAPPFVHSFSYAATLYNVATVFASPAWPEARTLARTRDAVHTRPLRCFARARARRSIAHGIRFSAAFLLSLLDGCAA